MSRLEKRRSIFVGAEINFASVGANIDGSQLFAEKGATSCSRSANYLFDYEEEEELFVARREISKLSANFLIAFRLVGYGNRYEFVFTTSWFNPRVEISG